MTYNVAARSVDSLYNAIMTYPWSVWTSLREAWVVAEHYHMTNDLKMYAALQTDTISSNAALRGSLPLKIVEGQISLGRGNYLNIKNGKPGDLPTTLWGSGWSTWCYQIDAAIEESMETNATGQYYCSPPFTWVILELDIQLTKLPYLMEMGYITTGRLPMRGNRNDIHSLRMHDVVPGEWISSVKMVTK